MFVCGLLFTEGTRLGYALRPDQALWRARSTKQTYGLERLQGPGCTLTYLTPIFIGRGAARRHEDSLASQQDSVHPAEHDAADPCPASAGFAPALRRVGALWLVPAVIIWTRYWAQDLFC